MAMTKAEECLEGTQLLEGIRSIISRDPSVPPQEVIYKPFTGSFSTIKSDDDPALSTTKYCMTDDACGHFEAYSRPDVPLQDLSCNIFCYISKSSGNYVQSTIYSINNPPTSYLNCGWEKI